MSDAYRDHLRQRMVLSGVPTHLQSGLLAYLTERRPTGDFLKAVLENDLAQASLRESPGGEASGLRPLVVFLHNYVPPNAFGSPAVVQQWLENQDEPVPELFE
jgi:hypothetical protein